MRPRHLFLAPLLAAALTASAQVKDLTANYLWKPVRIGAGGFVVGMVLHPLDPNVRYLRTDVGNAYRWDTPSQSWLPMRVLLPDGSGIHSSAETSSPSGYGIEAIAVDPTNTAVVYLVFPTEHSCDVQCPTNFAEVYKSTDGGHNFSPLGLGAAAITANPNGPNRANGERLTVDPANPQVLYYGSDKQGLLRSLNGGTTWTPYAPTTGLPNNIEFINIQLAPHSGTTTVSGTTLTKTVYAISIHNGSDSGGDVYQSTDGGQTFTDISTGVKDTASGQSLATQALTSTLDASDNLYITESSATNGYHRAYWKYAASAWQRISLEGSIGQPLSSVAIDPTNPKRIYVMGVDTSMSRSDDGGLTWISFGEPLYANTFAWLPQKVGMNGGDWHSNGCLRFDTKGNLWVPTGQEGALNLSSAAAAAGTAANPPQWTITSTGVEEMVSQDILIPHGSGDTVIATAQDTTGFVMPNPDTFSATQIPLQQETIAQGTSVDAAPDVPTYIAITSSNAYTNGPSYSGYSTDGGTTWHHFGAALKFPCTSTTKCDVQAGNIAVGLRGTRALGGDHLVQLPPNNLAPEYSQDGGATWHVTQSFPLLADGITLDTTTGTYLGLFVAQLQQHLLRSDPFTADRFYLKFTHAPASLYVSTDAGQTWLPQPKAALPDGAYHGQLVVNPKVQNDLWYADGWEGSSTHGIFHSTDAGATFTQLPGIAHAVQIAIGAPSPQSGAAAYTVYFYGQLSADPTWGVFQSTDAGTTWNRIAFYPTGIYDHPTAMAASPDTFGKVYLGLTGNSFVYAQLVATPPPPAPTSLTATAVSSTEIDLAWTAPTGTIQGYNVYRGTAAGAESSTPFATAIATPTYADKAVTSGTKYFYTVAAVNAGGPGPQSNEASALAQQPSLAFATGTQTIQTVTAGSTVTFHLTLNSVNYAGTISFGCAGTGAGETCQPPNPITVTPATTTTAVTVTIDTTSTSANLHHKPRTPRPLLAIGLLLCLGFSKRLRRKSPPLLALSLAALLPMASMTGCGGSSTPTPPSVQVSWLISATAPGIPTATQTLTLITN